MMIKQHPKAGQRNLLATALGIRGYLLKKSGKILRSFKKRFFIIIEDSLRYYSDETLDEPFKEFRLEDIKELNTLGDHGFTFFYKTSQYFFKAESGKQRDDWVSSLNLIFEFVETVRRDQPLGREKTIGSILKVNSEQTLFETQVRTTFGFLGLKRLKNEFHQDFVKCRIAAHLCTRGCLFLICCKSLVKEFPDQILLSKEFIQPYQLNALYFFDINEKSCKLLVPCEEISAIVLTGRSLRVNNTVTNLVNEEASFTQSFVDKLKASIVVGQEYRNKENITLRQNVDMLVSIFRNREDRLQKHHIQMKLEDEYSSIIRRFNHGYKKVYSEFQSLITCLIGQIEDTLNAISLKKEDLTQLSNSYSFFYYEKMHKLFKTFWNDNYHVISVQELVALTSLSFRYYLTVRRFVEDDGHIIAGVRILRDIFLKKMLAEVETVLKKELCNKEILSLTVVHTTNLPFEFVKMAQEWADLIGNHCSQEEICVESQKLLLEAAILVLITQLEIKMELQSYRDTLLVAFCNDIWIYQQELGYVFPQLDLSEVVKSLGRFHRLVVKKLYQQLYPQKCPQFSAINIKEYNRSINQAIKGMAEMHSSSVAELKARIGEDFNSLYFRSLVTASQKSLILKSAFDEMLQKIKADLLLIEELFQEKTSKKIVSLLSCLLSLFSCSDNATLKQCYNELKFTIFPEDFRQKDIKSLLLQRYSEEEFEERRLMLEDMNDSDSEMEDADTPLTRQRKQTLERTEAELLIKNDIDLEGYLQKKRMEGCNNKGVYSHDYFKLNSECLLWYRTATSPDLLDRIFITDIRDVYLHSNHPTKFFIDLKNGVRYKFKTVTPEAAGKWVENINASSSQPKSMKSSSFRQLSDDKVFPGFFEEISAKKPNDRQSMLSNYRNFQPSKLTTEDSPSSRPIRPKPDKLQGKGKNKGKGFLGFFGCASLQ